MADWMIENMGGLVRDTLREKGIPTEFLADPPPWLAGLVEAQVHLWQLCLIENPTLFEKKRRRGRPSYPNTFPSVVGFVEYLRIRRDVLPGATDNAIFNAVAAALGPGIDRDHVRRLVKHWFGRLGYLNKHHPQEFGLMLRVILFFEEQVAEYRRTHPGQVRGNSKSGRAF